MIWRAAIRFTDLRGNRLAGAVTFYGFVSLFPLLVLAAAIMSSVFGQAGVDAVQGFINENLPGFGTASESGGATIDVAAFYRNSGTIGVIGAVTLLITGLGWVDSMRAAVRSMWRLDDKPGSLVVRKLVDLAALVGLGVLLIVSSSASALLSQSAATLLEWFGIDGTVSRWALRVVAFVLAVGVSMLLFAYVLTGLPRIRAPLKELLWVSLIGGVAFEFLKQFLIGFVAGPASKNAYAAFATPLALLAWIYLITRVLMGLAALMAQIAEDEVMEDEAAGDSEPSPAAARAAAPSSQVGRSVRHAWAVGFAAGGVLGLLTLGVATLARRAGRAVVSAVRVDSDD